MNLGASFGSSRKTTTSDTSGQRDPWEPVIPYLTDFLGKLKNAGPTGITDKQAGAFDTLEAAAGAGNPWTDEQRKLTTDLYSTPDRTGTVSDAYTDLERRIAGYADGGADPMADPGFKALIDQIGTDAQDRIRAQYAGAGRDMSGMEAISTGKGVTQATLPVLVDQYNRNRELKIGTAGALHDAKVGSATTSAGLDAARAGLRSGGAAAGDTALSMENLAPNSILALEQQRKMLPYEDLAMLGSILFPAAGLGEQQTQTGKSTTKGTEMKLGASMNLLSDERAKEGIEEVGSMADGTPIYRYRYKGDPTGTVHMGPMAQEVESKTPSAVEDNGPGGMKMVNMDAATRRAAEIMRKRRGGQ